MNTDTSLEGFDTSASNDDEVFAGLHRTVAGATMTTSAADVVALGRRTRLRHRVAAAGVGTGLAAVVAAVGMLAPSMGSGAGSAARADGSNSGSTPTSSPDSSSSTTGVVLNIQEAGFSLEEHADGTVLLSLDDIFDPAKVQAAMDQAGIPAAILVRTLPDGWDLKGTLVQCVPDPGVHIAPPSVGAVMKGILKDTVPGKKSPSLKFNKAEIPAGDYITLERFESHGKIVGGSFSIKVGRQTTCVPEHFIPPVGAK